MSNFNVKQLLRESINLLPHSTRYWVKHVPLVAGTQRWLINRMLSDEPFLHTINAGPASGLRFEVTLPKDKAIWAGTFEPEFAEALRRGVTPGDVCYDIGGYRGYTAGIFALAGAERVIICEPLPENVAALQRLVELNPELQLSVQQVAVGKTDGQASFKIMPDQSMGKLADSAFQPEAAFAREIPVKLVKLDTLVYERGLPPPSVMKIDVEGAEVDVLLGGVRTLTEHHPRLFIEAHSERLADECSRHLRRFGYTIQQMETEYLEPEEARHLIAAVV